MNTPHQYPLLRRLFGTMGADWRAERRDPLDYLLHKVGEEDLPAVSAELDDLCGSAETEYDYVSVLIESGARFTPYGEFGTAADFTGRLRERVEDACVRLVADSRPAVADDPAPPRPVRGYPRLRRLLVMLYAKGLDTPSQALRVVDGNLGRLVDLGDIDPGTVADEVDDLLRSGDDADQVVARAGAHFTPDAAYPTTVAFVTALRDHLADPRGGGPEVAVSAETVIDGTLTAIKRGDLHAGMTGLARMYGVSELGIADFPAFERKVGELLDHVSPQAMAEYVDDATLAAETVADDASWARARWMRSALELVLTAHGTRAAAAFVDTGQIAQIDELLCAPTCRFGMPEGRLAPRFANSHWWWLPATAPFTEGGRAGLPMHPRWYTAPGVWRVRVPAGDAAGSDDPRAERRFAEHLLDATLATFQGRLHPESATAMVQVLDENGFVVWADASLSAEVRDGTFVVTDPDLDAAPEGVRVVTVATVRGTFGRCGHRAEWSVELLRRRGDDGREHTASGSAVFVLAASEDPTDDDVALLTSGDAVALADGLRDWERALGAPLVDWRSATLPTLVSKYGWGCDVVASGAAPAMPLLHGVSRNLWDGELRHALAGICRVHAAGLFGRVRRGPWREDWTAALAHLGRGPVEAFLSGLVDETRRLDYPRWHSLCAARSGIQLVGEELGDERLAGLFPATAVQAFDDAMRSFGRRFGPVPRGHVPGPSKGRNPLWDEHPWWRYPVNTADTGPLVDLDGLARALWDELDRSESARRTKAPTASLATVVRAVNAVCEGEAAGFTQRVAVKVCDQVRDRWDLGAALTDDVLRYFYPIARNTGWPLPAGNHDAARSLLVVEGSNASGPTVSS